jgi:hypothetical protein
MRPLIREITLAVALVVVLIGGLSAPAAAQQDPPPDVSLEEAAAVCVKAFLVELRDVFTDATFEELLPDEFPDGGVVLDVVEIRHQANEVWLKVEQEGVTQNLPFELAQLIADIVGAVGGLQGERFNRVASPALHCLHAAFVIAQEAAEDVAGWLQAAWVEAYYAGNWTGTVRQRDIDSIYQLNVTVTPGRAGEQIAVGSYSRLQCTVTWMLDRITLDSIFVRETVTRGECQDVDITLTRQSNGTLYYDFEDGNGQAILSPAG